MQNCGRLVQPQGHTVSRTERPVEAANTLNLWPEQHSQRQTFRVFSSSPSGDWGQEPLRQPRAPGPTLTQPSRGSHNLVLPEFRKPIRRKRSVSRCRLQISMTEIMRKRPSIVSLISELVSRRMPQHMRMNWKRKLSSPASPLDHSQEPHRRYWRACFRDKHIWAIAFRLWPYSHAGDHS